MPTYPNIEQLDASSCISGKLQKCNRIVSASFRKHFSPFDISNSQVSILFVMAKQKQLTQTDLTKILSLEKSTISRNLRRLFQKGYLKKIDTKQIELTRNGEKLLEKIIPEWEKAMKEVRLRLGKEGEKGLDLLLDKLTN